MSIARRNFLKSATVSTLSAGLALSSAHLIFAQQPARRGGLRTVDQTDSVGFPVPLEAQDDALFHFRLSTFKPYVGDIFQAPNARGEMIELKLIRASEYRTPPAARAPGMRMRQVQQSQSFTLVFSATEKLPPFTSTHRVSHPALGEFDLFLTGREADDGTLRYEAVFNHIQ